MHAESTLARISDARAQSSGAPKSRCAAAANGVVYVSCGLRYEPGLPSLIDYLARAAELRPDTTFLAERDANKQWRRLSYAAASRDTAAVATWLIRQGFGPDSAPIMILSENSIEHAVLTLGAMRAGVAVVPVSPTYSFGRDLSRLAYALDLAEPSLVYAGDAVRYAAALEYAQGPRAPSHIRRRLRCAAAGGGRSGRCRATLADQGRHDRKNPADLGFNRPTQGRHQHPRQYCRLGSNDSPGRRAVRCRAHAHGGRLAALASYLWRQRTVQRHTVGGRDALHRYRPPGPRPVRCDHRKFTGNFSHQFRLRARGVWRAGHGARDATTTCDAVSSRICAASGYGGALLPQQTWERMQRLAVQEIGELLPFGTGWGMTETTATGVAVYWNTSRTGLLGLPQPGVTLKLVPVGDRMELRIKGPQIMRGYYRDEALNAAAFDDEGFFKTGDAVRWVDPQRPLEGLEFAGRIAEDFKLLSATWVQASIVRRDLVEALQPYVSDAVICAPDRPYLGALVWLAVPEDERVRAALAEQARRVQPRPTRQRRYHCQAAHIEGAAVGGSRRNHR